MKKEDKIRLKEIGIELKNEIKELIKVEKYKKVSNEIYRREGEFLLSSQIYEWFNEGKFYIDVSINIKPYLFDNYFWEIFKMPSNINEKDSLRVIGAFSFPKFRIINKKFYIEENDSIINITKEILEFIKKETENFINFIEKNYSTFEKFILEGKELKNYFYDKEMFEIFSLVSLNKYKEAKKMAEEEINRGNKGNFKNEGKYIYEHLIEWCSEKIK